MSKPPKCLHAYPRSFANIGSMERALDKEELSKVPFKTIELPPKVGSSKNRVQPIFQVPNQDDIDYLREKHHFLATLSKTTKALALQGKVIDHEPVIDSIDQGVSTMIGSWIHKSTFERMYLSYDIHTADWGSTNKIIEAHHFTDREQVLTFLEDKRWGSDVVFYRVEHILFDVTDVTRIVKGEMEYRKEEAKLLQRQADEIADLRKRHGKE